MSKGHIIEGTRIAVNWWKPNEAVNVEFFFLSHFNLQLTDGLTPDWNNVIYTSTDTAKLLVSEKPFLSSFLRCLSFCEKHSLFLKSGEKYADVTLAKTDHCPGSCAYIFDGSFGRILYTGDFRYDPDMFYGMDIRPIDILYFDNTYCSAHFKFPVKSVLIKDILDFVREHIVNKRVILACESFGKEDLLVKIYNETKCTIKVTEGKMKMLEVLGLDYTECFNIDKVDKIVLVELSEIYKQNIMKWNSEMPTEILLLTSKYVGSKTKPFKKYNNISVLPYSSHSSFEELAEFLVLVQPLRIQPIILNPIKGMFDPKQGSLDSLKSLLDYLKETINVSEHQWVHNCLPSRLEDTQELMHLLFVLSPIKEKESSFEEQSPTHKNKAQLYSINSQSCGQRILKRALNFENKNGMSCAPSNKKFKSIGNSRLSEHPNSSKNVKEIYSLYSQSSSDISSDAVSEIASQKATGTLKEARPTLPVPNYGKYTQGFKNRKKILSNRCISVGQKAQCKELFDTVNNLMLPISISSRIRSLPVTPEKDSLGQKPFPSSQNQIESNFKLIEPCKTVRSQSQQASNHFSNQRKSHFCELCSTDSKRIRDDVPNVVLDLIRKCQRKELRKHKKDTTNYKLFQDKFVDITYRYKNGLTKNYHLKNCQLQDNVS